MALTRVSTPAIKDEAITLAKLLHGDSNSNGKFLRANNGADPTFETVNTDLVSDTSPQLGGDLASNGNDILLADSDKAVFGTGADLKIYHNGSHNYFLSSNGDYVFDTGSTELARLTTTGRLGIGDNAPDRELVVKKASSNATIKIEASNAHTSQLFFSDTDTENVARISVFHGSGADQNSMLFGTGGSTRLAITSAGNVGIGTISPSTNFHVHTSSNDTGITLKSTGNTSNAFNIDANRSGANAGIGGIKGRWNGTTVAQIGFNTGSDTTNKDDGYVWFGTETAASNGNVNATERLRIQSGGGISFNGDTAAANALDDYEEGNFTMTSSAGNGNSIVLNTSYNQGSYTKIGNLVHIQAYLSFSSNSNADSYLQLDSLPFTPADLADASGHGRAVQIAYLNRNYAYLPDGAGYYNVQLYINEGNTWIRLYDLNGSGRRIDTLAKFLGAGADIFLNFSYFAA